MVLEKPLLHQIIVYCLGVAPSGGVALLEYV
uniref:Uncharacterized protein n=1 Tax=Trichinella nativa TaxID=6335 RepID=A0A0V1K0X4_9BILA